MKEIYQETYEKLSTLQGLMQRYRLSKHIESGPFSDPTRGQGRVLAFLRLQPEISTKDLSYLLDIRQQSLNELLNKLEKGGFVERKPSEEDRRVMIVHLTEKGKSAEPKKSDYSDIFSGLSEEDMAAFNKYLDLVISRLEERVGSKKESMEDWMSAARDRFGDERFEKLMAMGRGGSRHGGDHGFAYGFGGFGRGCGNGSGPHGRGRAPEGMSGVERFDPDYDGPMPEGRQDSPCSHGAKGRNGKKKKKNSGAKTN